MATVRETVRAIQLQEARSMCERIAQLEPEGSFVRSHYERRLERVESGECECQGLDACGEWEVTRTERKKGRGGKAFFEFYTANGEMVWYFPQARRGAFVKVR